MSKGTRSILLIVLALCVVGVTLLVIIKNKDKKETGKSNEAIQSVESPNDVKYEMNTESETADLILATHNISIHGTDAVFSKHKDNFTAVEALLLEPGDTIKLTK